jgi:hypothetical protein
MDEVKKWAITISGVSILSGIISSLLPEDSYKKLFRFIAGVVLLYAVLQPLFGRNSIDFNIGDYLSDNYEVSDNIDKYAKGAMLSSVEKSIEDMFIDFAQSKTIQLKINCSCEIINNKIVVEEIRISECTPTESADDIKDFAVRSGFDESLLIFTGD